MPSTMNSHQLSSSAPCFPCDDVSAAAASTLLAMQLDRNTQQQQQEAPRQQCVAENNNNEGVSKNQQQPLAPPTNVGELVAKAKKAAVSLWMILHSQVRSCKSYFILLGAMPIMSIF